MALKLYDTLTPDGDYPLMKAKDVEMPDGTRLSEFKGGGSAEIPVFDFTSKGMEAVDISGGMTQWGGDTTELFEALNKGAVTFVLPIVMDGVSMAGYCTMHSFTDGASMHQCIGLFYTEADMIYLVVIVMAGAVQVLAAPMSYAVELIVGDMLNKTPAEINLTAFESEGKIVETYADGSTVTTTMERNAEGKITKITDSNGNVTVLTR